MNNNKRIYRPLLYKANVVWTNSEEVIIKYLNHYKKELFILTQKQLAIKTNTSEASVSRFCKKMGFESYKSFIFYFNQILLEFNQKYPLDFKNSKNTINNIISKNFFAIKNTLNSGVMQKIDKISLLISNSKKILIFGVGFSGRIAEELSMNLIKIGINAISSQEIESFLSIIASGRSENIYIIFFNETKEKEMIFLVEEIKRNLGILVLIMSNDNKFLNDHKTIIIRYEKIKDELELIPIASKISQSLIADAIFESTLNKKPFFHENLLKSFSMIKRWKSF